MFRDRLRLWGMNDKNQRRALNNCRRVKFSAGNEDVVSDKRRARHRMTASDLWIRLSIDARIHNTLSTSKKNRYWQRALKGVFDWHQSLQDSTVEVDEGLLRDDPRTFHDLFLDMYRAVNAVSVSPWTCKSATRKLQNASAAIDSHMRSTSIRNTPLTLLVVIRPLQALANRRNFDEWHDTASRFLLKTTAENLPACHPTLLLIKALLLDDAASEWLAIVYELGSDIIQRYYGRSFAESFQFDVVSGALCINPDAAIGSHIDMMCAAARNSNDAGRLLQLADLYYLKGRYPEAAYFAQRCLTRLRDIGEMDSWDAVDVWWQLSNSQRMQRDFTGEEESLLNAHAVTLSITRKKSHGSELSTDLLRSLSDLYGFYERNHSKQKCEALRVEYPSAFEL
jgi:hypothetical protein